MAHGGHGASLDVPRTDGEPLLLQPIVAGFPLLGLEQTRTAVEEGEFSGVSVSVHGQLLRAWAPGEKDVTADSVAGEDAARVVTREQRLHSPDTKYLPRGTSTCLQWPQRIPPGDCALIGSRLCDPVTAPLPGFLHGLTQSLGTPHT